MSAAASAGFGVSGLRAAFVAACAASTILAQPKIDAITRGAPQ